MRLFASLGGPDFSDSPEKRFTWTEHTSRLATRVLVTLLGLLYTRYRP